MLRIYKYRTVGNDFIIIDNRDGCFDALADDTEFKKHLNQRIFGIGSTGLVEVKKHDEYVFEMLYHVGTGERGLACGTGSRCVVAFARDVGLVGDNETFQFLSHEGVRTASVTGNLVTVSMSSDCKIRKVYDENNYFVDVKCYSHTRFVPESGFAEYDAIGEGMKVTDMPEYNGIFPPPTFMLARLCKNEGVEVRCFDRSSNDETEIFACGTGELGAAIAYTKKLNLNGKQSIPIQWPNGITIVTLTRDADDSFKDVQISGEGVHLFDAYVNIEKFKMTYDKIKHV